jgi:hypothetical protein
LSNSIGERSGANEEEMKKNDGGLKNYGVAEFLFLCSAPKTDDVQTSHFFGCRADLAHVHSYWCQYCIYLNSFFEFTTHNFGASIITMPNGQSKRVEAAGMTTRTEMPDNGMFDKSDKKKKRKNLWNEKEERRAKAKRAKHQQKEMGGQKFTPSTVASSASK